MESRGVPYLLEEIHRVTISFINFNTFAFNIACNFNVFLISFVTAIFFTFRLISIHFLLGNLSAHFKSFFGLMLVLELDKETSKSLILPGFCIYSQ